MDTTFHSLKSLFKQLGLPADCDDIDGFIAMHAPLHPSVMLCEANFWEPSQKNFLKDELLKDADWAAIIDQLNTRLREPL
jgi:hypothetical protein